MKIINKIINNSRIKGSHSIVIIIEIKMEMNMLKLAIKEMRKIFSMNFLIKKIKNMNKRNKVKRTIKNITNIILSNNKINKKSMKMHGNNICNNSKKRRGKLMRKKKESLNK